MIKNTIKVMRIYYQYDVKRKAYEVVEAHNFDIKELEKTIKNTKGKK